LVGEKAMKKIFSIIGVLILFIMPLAAVSCSSGEYTASLGKQFTLPIGKIMTIKGEDLKIGFEEVNGDSRCPAGAQCVWEGEAKCRGTITHEGMTYVIIFYQAGSTPTDQPLVDSYMAHYTLEPYPQVNQTIDHDDYRLVMTVTK
jgi:hypothetical protein